MNTASFHLLGDLERQIMEVVWKRSDVTVREVVESLKKKRDIAYTTVMTVMNRLVEKKILIRRQRSGAFAYYAAELRDAFMTKASGSIIRRLINECGEVAIAQFFEALDDVDPKKLALLEQKLKEKKS